MALLRELNISPRHDPDGESQAFYSAFYNYSSRDEKNRERENREDSPDESRASLIQRVHPFIEALPEGMRVLDLGAGREIFEKEYEDTYVKPKCEIVPLDIAEISKERLLTKDYPHIRATGRSLPFKKDSFGMVISNLAFDFMLPEALPELNRVIKPGGLIFLNLHHPSLLRYDIDNELVQTLRKIGHDRKFKRKVSEKLLLKRAVLLYHRQLRDDKSLFESEGQIKSYFTNGGFDVLTVGTKSDLRDKWWEVDLVKKLPSQVQPLNPNGVIFQLSAT
ncbi:methyltransferase domain-containing protein [Candidatus Roizmanbacteria bacterium]|nr:methyltransferase domain-containing protein [Candidatus Roizmanbacteria bacterium]